MFGLPALIREGLSWRDVRMRALAATPVELRRAARRCRTSRSALVANWAARLARRRRHSRPTSRSSGSGCWCSEHRCVTRAQRGGGHAPQEPLRRRVGHTLRQCILSTRRGRFSAPRLRDGLETGFRQFRQPSPQLVILRGPSARRSACCQCRRQHPLSRRISCQALSNVSGFPRIGAQRELKVATESYWSGERSLDDLLETARELRAANWKLQRDAGIDLIPSNDFSFYDQVLDTIALVGAVPERYEWDGSRRRRPRHLLRDGARPPGRRRRRDRDGDDEVVRHQLPLHRPRAASAA